MKELLIGTENEEIENPFSKQKAILCPEAVALYDFIKGSERVGIRTEEDLYKFYTARDIFINNWPTEWMILLD